MGIIPSQLIPSFLRKRGAAPQAANTAQVRALMREQQDNAVAESMRQRGMQIAQLRRGTPLDVVKTPDEKTMDKLLNPDIPDREYLNRYYSLAGEAARHVELTNVFDRGVLMKLQMLQTDLLRVGDWDAPEYFDKRQMKYLAYVNTLKAVSFTHHPTERQSLNESRVVTTQRIEHATTPHETSSFIAGAMGGGR